MGEHAVAALGSDLMSLDTWINLGGLALAAVGLLIGGIWQLTRSEQRVKDDRAAGEARIMKALEIHRSETDGKFGTVYQRIDSESRLAGEAVAAVRQQVNDNKIESLKTFAEYVRRDSFHQFLEDQREARRNFEADLKERLAELGRKVDRLVERERPAKEA